MKVNDDDDDDDISDSDDDGDRDDGDDSDGLFMTGSGSSPLQEERDAAAAARNGNWNGNAAAGNGDANNKNTGTSFGIHAGVTIRSRDSDGDIQIPSGSAEKAKVKAKVSIEDDGNDNGDDDKNGVDMNITADYMPVPISTPPNINRNRNETETEQVKVKSISATRDQIEKTELQVGENSSNNNDRGKVVHTSIDGNAASGIYNGNNNNNNDNASQSTRTYDYHSHSDNDAGLGLFSQEHEQSGYMNYDGHGHGHADNDVDNDAGVNILDQSCPIPDNSPNALVSPIAMVDSQSTELFVSPTPIQPIQRTLTPMASTSNTTTPMAEEATKVTKSATSAPDQTVLLLADMSALDAKEEAISMEFVLSVYTTSKEGEALINPISSLAAIYLNLETPCKIKSLFDDFSFSHEGKQWWRSSLHCPIQNRLFCSSIARICLPGDVVGIHHDDDNKCEKSIRNYFGREGANFLICDDDGSIFFSDKKMARKTAALGVLEALKCTKLESCLVSSYFHKGPDQPQFQNDMKNRHAVGNLNNETFSMGFPFRYISGNPISSLAEIYNKRGITEKVKSLLVNFSMKFKGKYWWRSSLSCPVFNQTFCSCIARICLPGELDNESRLQNYFGTEGVDYHICDEDGSIFFSDKKMAHQTAALSVLEAFDDPKTESCLVSTFQKVPLQAQSRNEKKQVQTVEAFILPGKYPKSIHRLYDIGVRSWGLHLEFNTDEESSRGAFLKPTMLVCLIQTQSPREEKVVSRPSPTMKEAFDDAIGGLENVLAMHISNMDVTRNLVNANVEEEKREMYKKYQQAFVTFPLYPPPSTVKDIYPAEDKSSSHFVYLYRMLLNKECLTLFSNSSRDQNFGIIFAEDINCGLDDPIEFSFPIKQRGGKVGNVTLADRSQVEFDSNQTELVNMLVKLSIILDDRFNYGRSKTLRDSRTNPFERYDSSVRKARCEMKKCSTKRTYLIVPIQVQLSGNSEENELSIDWEQVENILRNKTMPYDEWKTGTHSSSAREKHRAFVFQSTSPDLFSLAEDGGKAVTLESPFSNTAYESYGDYYSKKHEITIQHPELPLIRVKKVTNTKKEFECNPDQHNTGQDEFSYLVPELITVFPMSWDLIMMYTILLQMALPMERVIQLRSATQKLLDTSIFPCPSKTISTQNRVRKEIDLKLHMRYLEEATTVTQCHGKSYERMEHLGDSVLEFFTTLNYFSYNQSLKWGVDCHIDGDENSDGDLALLKSSTVTNEVLSTASLNIGINNILTKMNGKMKWETCYKCVEYCSTDEDRTPLGKSTLSDLVESLLAVALITKNEGTGITTSLQSERMIIYLLNMMQLPMDIIDNNDRDQQWFKPANACLREGFDFVSDQHWEALMGDIGRLLQSAIDVDHRLTLGSKGLISSIGKIQSSENFLETDNSAILLKCALFDDSMDGGDSSDPLLGNMDLEKVAMFRENLFFVGNAALYFALTTECFNRYPDATAGDLHLMRTCCVTDDILVYLISKHGVNEFLFDRQAEEIPDLINLTKIADEEGLKEWAKFGGWSLGLDEFRRRWANITSTSSNKGEEEFFLKSGIMPQYPGIRGGMLFGHEKGLGKDATRDLAYSFKCIVGALTLALGMDEAKNLFICPLFDEILLLSPKETRELSKSPLTKNYPCGKSMLMTRQHQALYDHGWSAI
eukprot:CAMPEP_0194105812 /NCGR_PEP_ID=MMETSP0150-20130528/5934_1 /TAXON_ID=122233 /ORGANISM="Chaetoceros debilis, Strain MM31A-1" /LENGTH=1664 /DNA_ID=CAMNT_0038793779 /DNA_START=395 /DNA_END=5389 /DNA_ORIENTATION=+